MTWLFPRFDWKHKNNDKLTFYSISTNMWINYVCDACGEHLQYCICSDGGTYDTDIDAADPDEESDEELDEGVTPQFPVLPPREDPTEPIPEVYPRAYPQQVLFFGLGPVPSRPYIFNNAEGSQATYQRLYKNYVIQHSDTQCARVIGSRGEIDWIIPYYVDETLSPVTIEITFKKRTVDSGRTTTLQLLSEDRTQFSARVDVTGMLQGETVRVWLTITEAQKGFYYGNLTLGREPNTGTPIMVKQEIVGCTTTIPVGYEWQWMTAKETITTWLPTSANPPDIRTFNVENDGSITTIFARGGRYGQQYATPTDPLLNQLVRRPYPVVEVRGGATIVNSTEQLIRKVYGCDVRAAVPDGSSFQLYGTDLTNELPDKMLWQFKHDGGMDIVRFLVMKPSATFPVLDPPPPLVVDPVYPLPTPAEIQTFTMDTAQTDPNYWLDSAPIGNTMPSRVTPTSRLDYTATYSSAWRSGYTPLHVLRYHGLSSDTPGPTAPFVEQVSIPVYSYANSYHSVGIQLRMEAAPTSPVSMHLTCAELQYTGPTTTFTSLNYASYKTISHQQLSVNRRWVNYVLHITYTDPTCWVQFGQLQLSVPPGMRWKRVALPGAASSITTHAGLYWENGGRMTCTTNTDLTISYPHHGHPEAYALLIAQVNLRINQARYAYSNQTGGHTALIPVQDLTSDATHSSVRILNAGDNGHINSLCTLQPM
jgi:hypothetical protein